MKQVGWSRYKHSPMVEVTCQVQFPDILTIVTAPPAAFQNHIRADYPLFQMTQDRRGYVFARQDRQAHVALSASALTVTAASFDKWGWMRDGFSTVESAFRTAYSPSSYHRTSVRFRSLIRPRAYGISTLEWLKLINGKILGPFEIPFVNGTLASSRHEVVMELAGGNRSDRFHLTHGFVTVTEPSKPGGAGEPGYLLDQHYFTTESLAPEQVATRLDRFSEEAAKFFRLCILDGLHHAMAPIAA